jgi:hypothetical protein
MDYTVIETKPATLTWTYKVTADSPEEAQALVENGEVESDDFDSQADEDAEYSYEVKEDTEK